MSYTTATASPAEKVLYRTTYHWLYWLAGLVMTASPLLYFAVEPLGLAGAVAAICAAAVAVPFGLVVLVRALTTEIVVTSDRFVKKTGLIALRAEDVCLAMIEEVNLDESILGAILGYGSIKVNGTGGSSITVEMVQSPWRLRREIENASELG